MTVALPSAADFPAVDPGPDDWETVEGAIGAPLEPKWRGRIKDALNHCVASTFFADEDAAKASALGVVRADGTVKESTSALALIRAMDSLVSRWARLSSEFKDSLVKYDAALPPGHHGVESMVKDAMLHRIALRKWMQGEGHAQSQLSPYDRMIRQAASIYRAVKGTEPTAGLSVTMAGERVSEFIRFVQALDSLLPEPARRKGVDTPGAWVAAVRRALAKHDKRGGN